MVRAKQLGMRVTLNPFVELSNLPGGQSWRAYFAPLPGSTVANTFWPLYETYLDEVATIAQNHHVDAMNVGTEMKGLDSFFSINDFDPATPGNQTNPIASPTGSAASILGHRDRFGGVDLRRPDRLRRQLGQFQFQPRDQQHLVAPGDQLHRHRFVFSLLRMRRYQIPTSQPNPDPNVSGRKLHSARGQRMEPAARRANPAVRSRAR